MAGPWEKYGQAGPSQDGPVIQTRPADPTMPYQGARAAADAQAAQAGAAVDTASTDARIRALEAEARLKAAQAQIAELEAGRGPQPTATEADIAAKKDAQSRKTAVIRSIMGDLVDKYKRSLRGQPLSRAFGATEYIDALPSNEEFTKSAKPQAKQRADADLVLPAKLDRKYLRVGVDLFRSGRDEKPDLSIKGKDGIRINKDHAIGDAVAIAKHNGWQSIRVHGSDEFKKAVFLEAARAGVAVKGFEPSPQLKLEGERLAARDKAREAQDPTKRASMAKQDPTESRTAAEQFRRNSHRENAANPQFKAAQSHVLAAAIEAKSRFPTKEDRDRFIERVKESVAKTIEAGAPVPAARFEQQRQNEATRIAREDTVLRQQERKPSRSR